MFVYSNDGWFSVWKTINGTPVQVQGWAEYEGIKPYLWNKVKVTADGASLKFYINGGLVWQGTDASFGSGKVGLGMYRADAGWNPLSVDWAKLTAGVSMTSLEEPLAAGIGKPVTDWDDPYQSPGARP